MHVFLTGGSGYIGRHTIPALLAAGHEVSALARSDEAAATVTGLGAEAVRGGLTESSILRGAASEADAVVHLGSTGGADAAAVDAAAATHLQAGVGDGPYVHTGGVWVYGDTDGEVGEDAPLAPPALTAWRPRVEAEVLGRADTGGHPVLVMPGVVYGEAGGLPQYALVETGRADGVVHFLGDGSTAWSVVHAEDIAALYVLALDAPSGSRYIGATEWVRQRDLAEALTHAPGNPSATAAWPLEAARSVLGPLADALALDQRVSGAKARAELGWSPTHTDVRAELAQG